MQTAKNKVALLVHACDRYEFLYKGFNFTFTENWDFNIPCNYYFATEVNNAAINGFTNIKSGNGEWADRLATLLNNMEEEYVLYFQEDMWLTKPVNAKFFTTLFEEAIQNNWRQVKLHSMNVYKTRASNNDIEGFNVAEIDNEASQYLMSHQVTLWKKDFLLAQLHKKEHPWRNERKGTKRLKKLNPLILHADYFAENGAAEINNNKNPLLRSEYYAVSFNSTLNNNILRFIEWLKTGSAAQKEYAAELQNHYDNNLTHDGNERPKKVDIFKKIKNFIQKRADN
ncbi:hypothetical protein ASE74_01470 [Pedobacter sp. Leaf216]|uniref:hypothetical protein n=1 Tax=Pedobacter sp. Leaf216 TaxID=1735684 RepID=UPI0006FD4C7D|nr:hypothetical protein [Pedobacter sp. Leaf216]KQM74683.1 hypothetical protein ASE74_01470 [Pedobacter sp. Leaf216]